MADPVDPQDPQETALTTSKPSRGADLVIREDLGERLERSAVGGMGGGMAVSKEDVALSPQLKEIADLVGGAEHIPPHMTIEGTEECDPNCERCRLVTRVELNAVTREKGDLFGDWNGGSGW